MEFVKKRTHTRIISDVDGKKTTQRGTSTEKCSPITLEWLIVTMCPICNNYKI
jgi:hypothetical protein